MPPVKREWLLNLTMKIGLENNDQMNELHEVCVEAGLAPEFDVEYLRLAASEYFTLSDKKLERFVETADNKVILRKDYRAAITDTVIWSDMVSGDNVTQTDEKLKRLRTLLGMKTLSIDTHLMLLRQAVLNRTCTHTQLRMRVCAFLVDALECDE